MPADEQSRGRGRESDVRGREGVRGGYRMGGIEAVLPVRLPVCLSSVYLPARLPVIRSQCYATGTSGSVRCTCTCTCTCTCGCRSRRRCVQTASPATRQPRRAPCGRLRA